MQDREYVAATTRGKAEGDAERAGMVDLRVPAALVAPLSAVLASDRALFASNTSNHAHPEDFASASRSLRACEHLLAQLGEETDTLVSISRDEQHDGWLGLGDLFDAVTDELWNAQTSEDLTRALVTVTELTNWRDELHELGVYGSGRV